ncbi:LOW QUALITY PROTEIN: TBC1 domain family member 22A [Erpetoichthys calabaricus]|uniref:LOW QUALITY PROTEIN: TBC1 domain family member 22A n=1 Tax=Erpetoichthys calabaricus TaxID=27687 RepID=UPI0022342C8D|nr:LOW QUALITY PROTEIN: TBC1 domain family member 22A [Erpetoichthys calabaricus]
MSNDGSRKQFWKRNASKVPGSIQHVYGAQHPPFDPLLHANLIKTGSKQQTTPVKPKKATTFQEFESITSDAWDVGDDDDDELLAMAAQNLNIEVVMETANKVIENHSKLQEQQKRQEQHFAKDKEDDHLDEEVEEKEDAPQLSLHASPNLFSEGRMVKSFSEAHIGSAKDSVSEKTALQRQQSLPHRPVIPLVARIADQNTSGAPVITEREASRLEKFTQLLAGPNTDTEELRKLSWSGIPRQVRAITWKILSIHIDIPRMNPESLILQPKVTEIHIDIPRTNPLIPLFQQASVQEIFERILFIWAIRHPASGYVQGINDLVTPFFVVYVFEYIEEEVENFDVSSLPEEALRNIEADSFWCMSKLLDGIQDNYTFAQPGIQRKVKALEELVSRIDGCLAFVGIHAFCHNISMSAETSEAEPEGFSHFHLYVCAAFLVQWRKEILEEKDFQGLMILLQNLPTMHWGNEEISVLLAEAYRLKYAFADAPNHYKR